MQDMIVSVYESKIINQQISYYILKEEYNKEKNGYVNESVGSWIKDKVNAFVKLVKNWLEKLGNLIKRVAKWIAGAVNKVLVFLKLKKAPETIDGSKLKDSEKNEAQEVAKKANKVVAVASTKSSVAPPKMKEEDATKYTEEQQKVADDIIANFVKEIEEKMNKAESKAMKAYFQDIIDAVKKNRPIILRISSNFKEDTKVNIVDTNLILNAIKIRLELLTSGMDTSIDIALIDMSTPLEKLDEVYNALKDGYEDAMKKIKDIDKDKIEKSMRQLSGEQAQKDIYNLLNFLEKNTSKSLTKKYDKVKTTLNGGIDFLDNVVEKNQDTEKEIKIINFYMKFITELYNEAIDMDTYAYSKSCEVIKQLG